MAVEPVRKVSTSTPCPCDRDYDIDIYGVPRLEHVHAMFRCLGARKLASCQLFLIVLGLLRGRRRGLLGCAGAVDHDVRVGGVGVFYEMDGGGLVSEEESIVPRTGWLFRGGIM